MLIGFVGDVHGLVFHALAALATWQAKTARRFELLIQVGDMGAFPDPARADAATQRYRIHPADLETHPPILSKSREHPPLLSPTAPC